MGEEVSWNGRVTKTASRRAGRSYLRTTMDGELKRGLSSRHMNMIAIGGAIGTGLFVASGATISQAGPGGALVAYLAMGLMVFLLMQSLGEMSSYLPVPGAFETYATRFVSPSFGFALGWNYWFNWAITVAAELTAASIVMAYWWPSVPSWMWSAGFLALLFLLNVLSARAYGEGEFWFAIIKVAAVLVFLVLGILMIAGIMGNSPGVSNWHHGDAPFVHGVGGIMTVFLIAGFSFQGTELIGIAAGESKDPDTAIPKATKQIFWRIMIFYIGAIAVIGLLLPYTDPNLLAGEVTDVAVSPHLGALSRQLRSLRLHPDALCPRAGGQGPQHPRNHQPTRCPGAGTHRHHPRRCSLLRRVLGWFWPGLHLVGQHLRTVWVHRLDWHCDMSHPVQARLPGTGA